MPVSAKDIKDSPFEKFATSKKDATDQSRASMKDAMKEAASKSGSNPFEVFSKKKVVVETLLQNLRILNPSKHHHLLLQRKKINMDLALPR